MSRIVTDAVFSSRVNTAPQEVDKVWIWFSSSVPPPQGSNYHWLKDVHVDFLDVTDFNTIKGDLGLTYASWDIQGDIMFWNNSLPSPGFAAHFARLDNKDSIKLNPIVVCKAGWKPFGEYLTRIFSRPERVNSLLVQSYGRRNLVPCDCCSRRYATACMPVQGQQVNVNWPFLECISMEGFFNGKCGNCIYHAESGCDYTKDFPCVKERSARRRHSFYQLGPRRVIEIDSQVNSNADVERIVKAQYKLMRDKGIAHNQIKWVPLVPRKWYPQDTIGKKSTAPSAPKKGVSGSGQAAPRPVSRGKDKGKGKAVVGSRVEKRAKSVQSQGSSSVFDDDSSADDTDDMDLDRTRREPSDDIYGYSGDEDDV